MRNATSSPPQPPEDPMIIINRGPPDTFEGVAAINVTAGRRVTAVTPANSGAVSYLRPGIFPSVFSHLLFSTFSSLTHAASTAAAQRHPLRSLVVDKGHFTIYYEHCGRVKCTYMFEKKKLSSVACSKPKNKEHCRKLSAIHIFRLFSE